MAKRACVLCGEMAGSWSLCYITLCGTSQTLCEKCMRRYRDAAGEEKIALREYMARSPHLREGEEVRERLPQARVQWQRELEQARERRQQEEQRQQQALSGGSPPLFLGFCHTVPLLLFQQPPEVGRHVVQRHRLPA